MSALLSVRVARVAAFVSFLSFLVISVAGVRSPIVAPNAPTLDGPADGAIAQMPSVQFTWHTEGAEQPNAYEFHLAPDPFFEDTTVYVSTGNEYRTVTNTHLDYGTQYWWRVRGRSGTGPNWTYTDWQSRTMTTSVEPIGNVIATVSGDSLGYFSLDSLRVHWNVAGGPVDTFNVQVLVGGTAYEDTTFANDGSTNILLTGLGLPWDVNFQGRVEARNATSSEWHGDNERTAFHPRPRLQTPYDGHDVSNEGGVDLQWEIQTGWPVDQYVVQVALDDVYQHVVIQDTVAGDPTKLLRHSTTHTVQGLEYNQIYWWRVKSINWAGVSEWNYGPDSFTTEPELPAAPVLLHPFDGAQDVANGGQFEWDIDAGSFVDGFDLEASQDSTFASVNSTRSTSGSVTVASIYAPNWETVYWRVRASNSAGDGPWSEVYTYQTAYTSSPRAPVLVAPSWNSPDHPVSGTVLTWTAYTPPRAPIEKWRVVVSTHRKCYNSGLVIDTTFAADHTVDAPDGTFIANGLDYDRQHCWKIYAINKKTTASGVGSRRSYFYTEEEPDITLTQPRDGLYVSATDPVSFAWTIDSTMTANAYQVQLSGAAGYDSTLVDTMLAGGPSQSVVLDDLGHDQTLFWRVRAVLPTDTTGWSRTWIRTLPLLPGAPLALTPADSATGVRANKTHLSWQPGSGGLPAAYELEVDTDTTFSAPLVSYTGASELNKHHGFLQLHLAHGTDYVWRIRARNAAGFSVWTTSRFTTRPALAAPELIAPEHESLASEPAPRLNWQDTYYETGYEAHLATDSLFTAFAAGYPDTRARNVHYSEPDTLEAPTYYWRARAFNDTTQSAWSEVWRFYTPGQGSPSDLRPHAGSHPSDSLLSTAGLALSWQPADTLSYVYDVQFWADGQMPGSLLDLAGTTGEPNASPLLLDSLGVSLSEGTTYRWRVRGRADSSHTNWATAYFLTAGAEHLPTLVTPADGDTGVSPDVISFTWQPVANPPAGTLYELQILDAGTPLIYRSGLTESDTTYLYDDTIVDLLAPTSSYAWRMRACITVCDHASGTTYPWTAPHAFETLREAPLLLGLKDNADYVQATWTSGAPTDTTTVAFFAWTTDQQATAYRLQLAPEQAGGSADFTQPWLEQELTTWTSQPALEDWLDNASMFHQALVGDPTRTDAAGYLVESVPMGTRMQWRVRAEGPGWASAWSQPKGFETEPAVVSRHYFVKDHLGSPRAVVDETGQVVEYRDHYPFGLEMPGRTYVSGVESRENFTGHERDTETGLVYAGARYLDAEVGFWISIDPMQAQFPEWSPYNYVMNNPLRYIDPDGLDPDSLNSEVLIVAREEGSKLSGDFGHMDLRVSNSDGSYTVISFAPLNQDGATDSKAAAGMNVPGKILIYNDGKGPPANTKVHRIPTTQDQNEKIVQYANSMKRRVDSGEVEYSLYSNSCVNMCVNILNDSGSGVRVPEVHGVVLPSQWADQRPFSSNSGYSGTAPADALRVQIGLPVVAPKQR